MTHPAVSPDVARVPGSGIREIFNLALGRADVLHLEIGEPDFATPAHIVEAAVEAARAGARYTATAGLLPVREAAAARLARVHGLDVDPGNMLITQGAAQGIATVMAACVAPSDEVLVPDPAWPNYEMLTMTHGARAVRYPLRASNGFLPDPDEVRSLVTTRTKLLVVNGPSNPTGAVLDRGCLERLVTIARDAGVLVVSDEVYDEIVFGGEAPASAVPADPEWVVGIWACSKAYAMTGWRVGYLAAPTGLIGALTTVQEASITCVSSVSQAAALAAFEGPQECVAEMRDAYGHRRDVLLELLREADIDPVVPGGAFYLMLPLAKGADARLCALDLVAHGVAVAPGTAFGTVASDQLRISLAASEDTITHAAERMTAWYTETDGGLSLE